jgi:DNA helicase HerA-like ATPase
MVGNLRAPAEESAMADPMWVAKGETDLALLPQMANRHGLIAGATGTGKTVTLQVLAEELSRLGTPVFLADVKGDLAGLCQPGAMNPKIEERLAALGLSGFPFLSFPVTFWDLFGEEGHPVRTTVSEMGPLLLSRILDLNDTQEGVLALVFKIADDQGLLLLDLKDLRAMLQFVADNARQFTTTYGNVSSSSVGAIQRGLLQLEQQGGDAFFSEPALNLFDFLRTGPDGRGMVNILAAGRLMQSPRLYATFLLWLLSELYENLPEVGDLPQPKLVFFFDEAHLLFRDAPSALIEKIEQVVRLVRSKGVGVFFVTQNPMDIPEAVLAQLGNRVQHALRAYTPMEQKAVKAAAQAFRPNPRLDTQAALTQLGVGEALVSLLDEKGVPAVVQRALIRPPHSRIGAISPDQRRQVVRESLLFGKYDQPMDRDSAYERLSARSRQAAQAAAAEPPKAHLPASARPAPRSQTAQVVDAFAKSAVRAVGSSIGRQIVRGVLGSIFGRSR